MTLFAGITHPQAEARVAGGRNKLVERQSEVYIERLAARCQVHYRRSIAPVISQAWPAIRRGVYSV